MVKTANARMKISKSGDRATGRMRRSAARMARRRYKSECPQGHHDCLEKLPPQQVVDASSACLVRGAAVYHSYLKFLDYLRSDSFIAVNTIGLSCSSHRLPIARDKRLQTSPAGGGAGRRVRDSSTVVSKARWMSNTMPNATRRFLRPNDGCPSVAGGGKLDSGPERICFQIQCQLFKVGAFAGTAVPRRSARSFRDSRPLLRAPIRGLVQPCHLGESIEKPQG